MAFYCQCYIGNYGIPSCGASLLIAPPYPNRNNASSSACKNRDRSALAEGAGPPVMPSIPARRSAMIARVAMALPMEAVVNGLPLLRITVPANYGGITVPVY